MTELFFTPVLLLVILTLYTWVRMYRLRVAYIRQNRIPTQRFASGSKGRALLPDAVNIPAEHLANLLEVPVLFYVWTTFVYMTGQVNVLTMSMAFVYVLLRYLHSFVHLGYNNVIHRFYVYGLSCLVLWAMWLIFGIQLIFHLP